MEGRSIDVVVIEGDACHLCEDARAVLESRAGELNLSVRYLSARSDAGRRLIERHRAPMLPVVFVEGELLGWGRLSRKKLERRVRALRPTVAA